MKIAITSVSSQKFAPYICALARSVARNAPDVYLRVRLVNPSAETVQTARAAVKNGEVTEEHIELRENEVAGYCSNTRVRITHEMLKEPFDAVINLDADTLVRGDITPAVSAAFGESDVLLFRQSRIKVQEPGEKLFFLASMSMFKNTPGGRQFVEAWVRELKPMAREWFGDQIALYRAFRATEGNVTVGDIPDMLLDTGFSRSGLIWMAKGNRKYANAVYQYELMKYSGEPLSPGASFWIAILQEWFRLLTQAARLKRLIVQFLLTVRNVLRGKKEAEHHAETDNVG